MSKWLHYINARTKRDAVRQDRQRAEARKGRLGPVRTLKPTLGDVFGVILITAIGIAVIVAVVALFA